MIFCETECIPKIETRNFIYGDYRDWFIEQKSIKIYNTDICIFINDVLLWKSIIPINLKKITINIKFKVLKTMILDTYTVVIPEMGLIKNRELNHYSVSPEDSITLDACLEMEI